MAKGSATIYDVAEVACVSIATVSRVLNDSANVRADTRDRVHAAIKQLHFVPSTAARSLSGGRRGAIGLAYPLDEERTVATPSREDDASVLYTDAIIRGASWQASQLGYSLFACAVRIGGNNDAHPLHQLSSAVDGIILTDRVVNNVKAMRIAKRMHAVHLSGSGSSRFGGTIRVDNSGGISALVRHLADVHGTRNFGFVGGIPDSPDATARFDAVVSSVTEVGGRLDPENVLVGDFSLARAEAAIEERLRHDTSLPDVFVCANDQMALGVVRVLRDNGHHVPDKILVTGFDDIPVAGQIYPTLTTVTQPSFELGVAAVNMVIGLLDGEVAVGAIEILPTTLVVRGSCGCPIERSPR